jgi:PAS domain S-box-containing protein
MTHLSISPGINPTISPRPAGNRHLSIGAAAPALFTLVLGLVITIALFMWLHRHEQDLEDSLFAQRAGAHVLAFQEKLTDAVQALELVNQSFKTFTPVSREQFHAFTEPLLARYPYIQNFSFHRLVSKTGRASFEAEMRKDYPGFSVTDLVQGVRVSAPVRKSYRVINYLEPMAGNEAIFGLDVGAFTSRQDDAIHRAIKTGKASASGLFHLPQLKGDDIGFAIVMAVYRQDARELSSESQPNKIIGYTLATLRATDFVERVLTAAELLAVSADISVYVGARSDEGSLVYRKGASPFAGKTVALVPERLFRDDPQAFARTLSVAGMPWHIVISAQPAPLTKHHLGSLLALVGGVLSSFLAAGYIHTLALRSERTQRLVDERTAELKVANQRLIEDIAAREQTEESLQQTQHILMNAQKIAHLGSWLFNANTHELQCSDEFFRICGLEPQSVKASIEFALSIVHPDDRDAAKTAITATLEECKEYRIEKRIVRPDGSVRHVASRGEMILNEAHEQKMFIGSFLDVTEQKETEVALRKSQEELRELAAHLEQIREDERKRIAREIHDELGALLTGIKAHLSVAIETAAAAGAQPDKLLIDAAQLADVATDAVRGVITDLRPSVLDDLGVWAALEWYVGRIEEPTRLSCECVIDADVAAIELPPDRSTMVFRVVQESLTNVMRHANASHVTVHAMLRDASIVVVVEDNGKGLDTAHLLDSQSWGIVGMHERARYFGGELTISGTLGHGTTVTLRLPLESSHG